MKAPATREGDLVVLHCRCGGSFVGLVHHKAQEKFTRAWYQVHCGEGHGPSKVPVVVVDVEELLASVAGCPPERAS